MRIGFVAFSLLLFTACGGSEPRPTADGGMPDLGMPDMTTPTDLGMPDTGPPDGGPTETVHFLGRFDRSDAAGPRFAWSGTAISARFTGTGITMTLADSGNDYFDVTVDGVAGPTIHAMAGTHDYVLASGLAEGTHDVVVARRTEAYLGVSQFLGFSGATLVPSARPTRFLEFVGDAITCGYGVLGASSACVFSAATEAETHAWGAIASRTLGAAHVSIAYSGKGLSRNYGGETTDTMPALYDRVIAEDASSVWDFSDYVPDAVVVNLGTSDFATGDPGMAFIDAGTAFVTALRAHWPSAWIVLAPSPMLMASDHLAVEAHLQQIVAASGDARVVYLSLAEQSPADGYGCDFHPSEVTHGIMAAALVAELRTRLGW